MVAWAVLRVIAHGLAHVRLPISGRSEMGQAALAWDVADRRYPLGPGRAWDQQRGP
jgi:hypothetical protein